MFPELLPMVAPASKRVSSLLGMFAKHWQPGCVKTRLAATIGESHAATLHALCVSALTERLATSADRRVIAFTPAPAEHAFRCVSRGAWEVLPQGAGDLGQRMQQFFHWALSQAERVVLIGSDSPDLPGAFIEQAFASLQRSDVVLGPAQDGGYYLIGAARRVPPVFERIAWSTPQVWPQTVDQLAAAGIAWHELPGWYDVDDQPALNALLARLRSNSSADPTLAKLAAQLHPLLSGSATRGRRLAI